MNVNVIFNTILLREGLNNITSYLRVFGYDFTFLGVIVQLALPIMFLVFLLNSIFFR